MENFIDVFVSQVVPRLIGIFGAVFLFGFAVFVHELGHFLMAKWAGVGVKAFSIGFGKWKIWSKTVNGTEYSVRWIPLGGFVALKGMIEGLDEEEAGEGAADEKAGEEKPKVRSSSVTEDLDALRNKSPWVRVGVFASGVTMNFLTAIVFMAIFLWYGLPKPVDLPNALGEVPQDSRLYELGWRTGDEIAYVRGESVSALDAILSDTENLVGGGGSGDLSSWSDVEAAIGRAVENIRARRSADGEDDVSVLEGVALRIGVRRGMETRELTLPLSLFSDADAGVYFSPPRPAYVGAVIPGAPAFKSRLVARGIGGGEVVPDPPSEEVFEDLPGKALEPDDRILAINGAPVATWREMTRDIQSRPNEIVVLTVLRGKGEDAERLLLAARLETRDENPDKGQLGIISGLPTVRSEGLSLPVAIWQAPGRTLSYGAHLVAGTVQFFRDSSGRQIRRNLGGPVAIGIMTYKSAQRGLTHYLNIFIAISIILGVMNLLPIPVLDGGYILITLIEAVIRRPIPQRVLSPVLTTFMILFMMLFAFLFLNDIMNWIVKH